MGTSLKFSTPRAAPWPHLLIVMAASPQLQAASPGWPRCFLPPSCPLPSLECSSVCTRGSASLRHHRAEPGQFPSLSTRLSIPLLLGLPPPPSPLSLSQRLGCSPSIFPSAAGPAPPPAHPGARCCRMRTWRGRDGPSRRRERNDLAPPSQGTARISELMPIKYYNYSMESSDGA